MYKVQASICVFTEVGELWNKCRLPHFNTFYQKGTNRNGGASIAIGKHLKAMRVEVDIPNTIIIDIPGLSPMVRLNLLGTVDHEQHLQELLPVTLKFGKDMIGNNWTFCQGGRRPHFHQKSQDWCRIHFPSFIDKEHWPSNTLELIVVFGMSLPGYQLGPSDI